MYHKLKVICSITMNESAVSVNESDQVWYFRDAVRSGSRKMVVVNSFKQCYPLAKLLTAEALKAFTWWLKVSYVTETAP